jgi:hypothetical protein
MFFSVTSTCSLAKFSGPETSYLLNASAEFNPLVFSSPAL